MTVVTSRRVVVTSRDVVMTSRGVAVTSRGVAVTSRGVESTGAVVFVRFDELGRDRDSVKNEKSAVKSRQDVLFSSL